MRKDRAYIFTGKSVLKCIFHVKCPAEDQRWETNDGSCSLQILGSY